MSHVLTPPRSVGKIPSSAGTAGLVFARRLRRLFGVAALLALASAAPWVELPVARAYDGTYYQWCLSTIGQAGYCCNQAGGVWTGGSCTDVTPSQGPTFIPPNSGFFLP